MNRQIMNLNIFLLLLSAVLFFSCVTVAESNDSISKNVKVGEDGKVNYVEVSSLEQKAKVDISEFTESEKIKIKSYIDSMTYLIYFNDNPDVSDDLLKTAVFYANEYLEKDGLNFIQLTDIEQILNKPQDVYLNETEGKVGFMQWAAYRVQADIYFNISTNVTVKKDDGKYFVDEKIVISCYDINTFNKLFDVESSTKNSSVSNVSEEDAIKKAFREIVPVCVSKALDEVRNNIVKAAINGFSYKIIIQKPENQEILEEFADNLSYKVKLLENVSTSPEQVIYDVLFIGEATELESLVCETAATVEGLDSFRIVMQRENELSFNTGL
ncbi:MAG: hypothetical protein PQJ46_16615 [Spirochaetales bacterium]|nr:hypothetical protein [Spirochaetales bacterium]